ncbi:MAG: FAD binding domain-containing protein [Gaiella sp.]
MKPVSFAWAAPRSLDEALAALAEHGEDAKPIAGGQSLVPALNLRLVRPSALVDLTRVGLDRVEDDGEALRVGATVRQRALERDARTPALVRAALPHVGHTVTRNRGTIGGSIAHADGGAELPLCLVALGGSVVLAGSAGVRKVAAEDFFVTHYTTAIAPGEILIETRWPHAPRARVAFEELALRAGDYALAMVAVVVREDEDGIVQDATVAVGAVTDRPVRLPDVETMLLGTRRASMAEEAGATAARLVDPPGSLHASTAYLRALTGTLVTRAIASAA